jgi:stearoyl-CoA desaturase (delta-9 desaturase)
MIGLIHILPLYVLLTGTKQTDWIFFFCLLPIQGIGVGVAMHRYFAHRSFKTSRAFQFFLALCAAATFGNPLAFAGKHRIHHAKADKDGDVHSPRSGFWACWYGSLVTNGYSQEELLERVPDLVRFPELMFLHRNPRVVGIALVCLAWFVGGVSTVAIGVCLGVVIMITNSGLVNYFCHVSGTRRFETDDYSRNNALVALLSFGEGWHNNHHYYPASARAGFYWWEIDVIYWIICVFESLGLVWDVRRPPARAYASVPVK